MKKFCFLFLIICGLMVFCLQDCQARQKLNLADLENKYNAVIGVYAVDMENGKKFATNLIRVFPTARQSKFLWLQNC